MPSPAEAALLVLAWVTGAALLIRYEVRTAPPGTESERNLRGLAVALLAVVLTAPVTFGIALASSDRPLPVKPPGASMSCDGSSSGGDGTIVVIAILLLALVRFGPALVAFLWARRPFAACCGVPASRLAFRLGAVLVSGLTVLAVVRLLLGGVSDTAFTTYGAVTPPGASGRRVDATIGRHLRGGRRHALGRAPAIDTDVRPTHGHLRLTLDPLEVDGLKAWIAGRPVNLVGGPDGRLLVQDVRSSGVDPARRPRWSSTPWWGESRGEGGQRLLVGPAEGSGRLAVRVEVRGVDVDLVGIKRSDVGLQLRPPLLPLGLALLLAALALALWARSRGRGSEATARAVALDRVCRAGAAAFLLEAAMLLYGAYRIFV